MYNFLENEQFVGMDTEYEGGISGGIKVYGMSLATTKGSQYFENSDEIQDLLDYLGDSQKTVISHFAFYDYRSLTSSGYRVPILDVKDTSFKFWNEKSKSLRYLSGKYLTRSKMDYEDAIRYGKNSQIFKDYAKLDAELTLGLYGVKMPPINNYDLMCQAIQPLAQVACNGIPVDLGKAYEQYYRTETIEEELESWIKHELNSTSDRTISKFLENFYHPDLEYTDSGKISAKRYNCKLLAPQHEMIEFIFVWKLLKHIKSIYLKPIILAAEESGKYYPEFNQVRRDIVQKLPFNMGNFYKIRNQDLTNALNQVYLDSCFSIHQERVEGLEGFIKLKDYSKVCNWFSNKVWYEK